MFVCTEDTDVDGLTLLLVTKRFLAARHEFDPSRRIEGSRCGIHPIVREVARAVGAANRANPLANAGAATVFASARR
jgi:hypothetical protein